MMVIFILFYVLIGYVDTAVQYKHLKYDINGCIAH